MTDFTVNGRPVRFDLDPQTPLLWALRDAANLTGTKYGCGVGDCGACMVLIDGAAARSCAVPASLCEGREIVTLEGLGSVEAPHPIQQAFIDAQAAQCGYCINGMIMTAKALLDRNPSPLEAEACEALRHNLCRCGTHVEILRAVMLAAERQRAAARAGA